ncbi:probable membrane-associated kinase regulator 1 [Cannabis sativa]|uniref:probable membrane-associated kinase regulator 1 n=1 Tax=Cannabis sativa TaxID=3483 RepID=UPI0029CA641D|nr:probable membrane-associated kinase regulator 1 [Cannabis sativa]
MGKDHSNSGVDDHQEEEDVSLCDLLVEDLYDAKNDAVTTSSVIETQDDEFAFGGSLSTASEMCTADELFFGGQILPLRLSVSSDAGPVRNDTTRKLGSGSEFISSRSSSCSSRSTQHSTTIAITRVTSEPRLGNRNHFFFHPSPKPQIRASSARLERVGSINSTPRKHKFSMWDFFRLGLVRTPDIEFQELNNKVNFIRSNSRVNNMINTKGSSSSSSPSVSRNNSVNNNYSTTGEKENGAVLNVDKQKRMKFLSGCKCSADAAVAPNVIVVKSKGTTPNAGNCSGTSVAKHSLGQQQVHEESKTTSSTTKIKGSNKKVQQHNNADQKQRQKQAMSHHRTYEWLKELSHANLSMHV